MKRDLKKSIKQDEFRSTLETIAVWLAEHQQEAKAVAIVVVLLVAGGVALNSYRVKQVAAAEGLFSEGLAIYQAPVQGALPAQAQPTGVVYGTAEEKYTAAAAAFDGIERKYASQAAGRRAAYYAALCRVELGQLEDAETALKALAAEHDQGALEPSLARLALANLKARTGRVDEAVEAYEQLLGEGEQTIPRDHALMQLAAALERAERSAEAAASYRRLSEEFPTSVYAQEARRRAEYLQTVG